MAELGREEHIEVMNDHLVGSTGRSHVVIMLPPLGPIPYEEALRLAAWIIVIADEEGTRFNEILEAIKNT